MIYLDQISSVIPNSGNFNTYSCILQHFTLEYNTTFGNITSLILRIAGSEQVT